MMAALYLVRPQEDDMVEVEAFKQEFIDANENVINGGALLDQLGRHWGRIILAHFSCGWDAKDTKTSKSFGIIVAG